MRLFKFLLLSAVALTVLSSSNGLRAQDLLEELQALEDEPESDFSDDAFPGDDDFLDDFPEDQELSLDAVPDPQPEVPEEPRELAPPAVVEGGLAESQKGSGNAEDVDDLESELGALDEEGSELAQEAMTGVDVEAAAKVSQIDFKQFPDRVRLRIKSSRAVDFRTEERPGRRQVLFELQNTLIGKDILKRALDTGEFDGPVALVQAFEAKAGNIPNVKILLQLREFAKSKVSRFGSDLLVDFPISSAKGELFRSTNSSPPVLPDTMLSSLSQQRFSGERINLKVKGAPMSDILALLSKASGKDFVLADPEAGNKKVTLNVRNTPWDQVFAIILLNNKLGYQLIGNTYRIAAAADLQTEITQAAAAIDAKNTLELLTTRIFPINYTPAGEVDVVVKDFLSKRGKTKVETRTNSLVVSDISSVLQKIEGYIRKIDIQTPQVLIEGRIVEASVDSTKSLKINWDAQVIPNNPDNPSFINVGENKASEATTGGDAIKFGLSNLGFVDAIGLFYAATKSSNKVNTISSPRVVVLNNTAANIRLGSTVTIDGGRDESGNIVSQVINADLSLNVTPTVTPDNFVRLNINLSRAIPKRNSLGQASVETRDVQTELLVESGKTVVIGGVYVKDETSDRFEHRWLSSIPILGQLLFTPERGQADKKNELMMFISPKILNTDRSLVLGSKSGSGSANF